MHPILVAMRLYYSILPAISVITTVGGDIHISDVAFTVVDKRPLQSIT
jgi:hypothetical protein